VSVRISPSILAADLGNLANAIQQIETGGADAVHVDVMDGHFVPNLTMGVPVVASLSRVTRLPIDVHLMIEQPERYLDAFVGAGASWVTVHAEVSPHLHRTITRIHDLGARAGVAINPATHPAVLDEVAGLLDYVLVMSVNPGFTGQSFIPESIEKVARVRERLRARHSTAEIEVDGGVDAHNAAALVAAGADILVAGASVYHSPDPAAALRALRKAADAPFDR
jgi:ribulose-phosphate 3-epimerase